MLKQFVRRAAAALGFTALFLGAPAQAQSPAARTARPALWEVSDPDTTIYLFGTIHLLPEHYQWQTPKFEQAVKQSQELVVETIVDPAKPEEFMSAFGQMALSPTPLPPMLERVAPAKRAALKAAIAKIGATPEQLARVKTWALAFQLMGLQFTDLGLHGQEGPEAVLRQEFTAAHKPIDQLETIRQQLGFFDSLSEPAQRALLEGTLDSSEATRKEFGDTLGAWSRGDVHALAKAFQRDIAGLPELKQALFERRNANWARWIERRLAQPGTIMVAVGADHLAANGSVIELLQKDGYKLRRLQ